MTFWKIALASLGVLVVINVALALILTCDDVPLARGAPVPAGAVPVGGIIGIPASATCAGGTACADPGAFCWGLIGTCTDTFNVTTAVCECQCLF